jgi:hypothetical protein
MMKLVVTAVRYFSQRDEDAFFGWLKQILSVQDVKGAGGDLFITVDERRMTDTDLREFLALFHRYAIDKKPLRSLLSSSNAGWFRDDVDTYWHKDVFE